MANETKPGIVLGQKHWNGNWEPKEGYESTKTDYAGSNYNYYYPFILKFQAPAFLGVSQALDITLNVSKGNSNTTRLRWALCDSDENLEMYRGTNGEVADSHQLVTGIVTMENMASDVYRSIHIETTKVRSGGTYYLFLWGYAPQTAPEYIKVRAPAGHTITLSIVSGIVHVKVNGKVISCMPIVKTGGKLMACMAGSIKNGKFSPGG